MKNELLSTISHELRTPLTLVHGYAQMLQRDARAFDPRVVEETARRIVAGSTQLNRLVTDLVDFGRAERGELEVQVESFDLASVLNDLAPSYQVRTGGRLRVEMAGCLDVCGDCVRVAQVVSNLLDNAAKYAPEGPITLRAVRVDGTVRVEVVDRGPGIPAHEQTRVWEKFFRSAEVTDLHLVKGSGIGLAVVKALVEAQGGRVGLESAPGQGSSFWFELPALPADEQPQAEQPRPAAAALGVSMRTGAPAGGLHNHAASA